MSDSSLREALERICDDYSVVDIEMLQETLAAHPAGSGRPVLDLRAVRQALDRHVRVNEYGEALVYEAADAVMELLRSEAEVKAEALREAADGIYAEDWWTPTGSDYEVGDNDGKARCADWLRERADELEGKR